MDVIEPNLSDLQRFLSTLGKRAADVLSEIGKVSPFIHAVCGTEIGREILKDDLARLQGLFSKIFEEKATPEEMAEFRVLKNRIGIIAQRLNIYLSGIGMIKKVAGQE